MKMKLSEVMKEVMNRPEVKLKLKEYYNRPEVRLKQSVAMREVMSRPEIREKHRKAMKEYWCRPEVKEKHREAMKEYWDKSEIRAKSVARVIEIMSTPFSKTTPHGRYSSKGKSGKNRDKTMPRGVDTLIAAHNEMMKDDPERLSTEFMIEMIKN